MPSSPICALPRRPTLRPLAVASLSADQAALARQIGRGRQAALPALGPDVLLTLQMAGATAPPWLDALTVQGSFGQIELARGARLLRVLTGIDLGKDNHGPEWDWLQAAVCARLDATPLAGADSLAPGLRSDATPDLVTVRLTLRGAGHMVATHARASAADWLRLLADEHWQRLQAPLASCASLALQLPVQLARHRLPHTLLATLAPGDVLQPAYSAFDCSGQGRIALGALDAIVRYQAPGSFIILSLETRMDASHEMTQEMDQNIDPDMAPELAQDTPAPLPDGAAPALSGAALNQLPVTLDIELGTLTLTLGALRSLAAGSTLRLAGADSAALTIRSAGRLLGRAEAVDIDGCLGVRITEWSAA